MRQVVSAAAFMVIGFGAGVFVTSPPVVAQQAPDEVQSAESEAVQDVLGPVDSSEGEAIDLNALNEATGDVASSPADTAQADTQSGPSAEQTAKKYEYVAQPGDSYTVLVRKAVQTYGIENEVSLSPAHIVFIETNMTQLAGSPPLVPGQPVAIDQSVVKDWVEKAQQLSSADEAAWATYVPYVDFVTDDAGEPASS